MRSFEEQERLICEALGKYSSRILGTLADRRTIADAEAFCRGVLSDLKKRGEIHLKWDVRVEMGVATHTLKVWLNPPLEYVPILPEEG